jgi:hypothetical protein
VKLQFKTTVGEGRKRSGNSFPHEGAVLKELRPLASAETEARWLMLRCGKNPCADER